MIAPTPGIALTNDFFKTLPSSSVSPLISRSPRVRKLTNIMTNTSSSSSNCRRRSSIESHYVASSESSFRPDESYIEMNYEGGDRYCGCGLKAPRFTAWRTKENPGRRYFGCPNWTWKGNERVHHCKYFVWFDEKFCDRSVEVIRKLKDWLTAAKEQGDTYKRERNLLKMDVVHLVEEREGLKAGWICVKANEEKLVAENNKLTAANAKLSDDLKKAEGWVVILMWLCGILVFLGVFIMH